MIVCCRRYRRDLHRPDRVRRDERALRPGQEPDDARAARRRACIDCITQERPRAGRHRRADPRLDDRDQHADRAKGRQDRRSSSPRGTRDVYIIGRGNRPEAYNLFFHRPSAAGAAPAHARGRRAAARLGRGVRARSIARGDRASLPRARRRGRRGGRGLLPARLRQSRARARRRRDDPRRAAGRLCVAVARDPARVSRVRADVDDGGQRLYRPEGRRLCEEPEIEPAATSASAARSRSCARTAA